MESRAHWIKLVLVRSWVVAAVLVAAPAEAIAHTTPAVLGPAGPSADPLAVVRIAHGLAHRGSDGVYRYVCPAAWGGPERPPTAGGTIFGVGGTFALRSSGRVERSSDLAGVLQAAASSAGVFAVVRNDVSRVFRVDGGAVELYAHTGLLDGLVADAETILVAAAAVDGSLTLVTIATSGSTAERTVAADLSGGFVTPVRTDDAIWIRARDPVRTRIGRVEATGVRWVVTSTSALFGPYASREGVLVVEDGALVAVAEDGESVVDDTRRYTCLEEGFVCTLRTMYRVDDRGTPVFELDRLEPPDVTEVEDEIGCRAQWIDLATEAGLPGVIETPDPEPPANVDSGCACTSGRGGGAWILLVPLIVSRKKERLS